jgi:dGTP triphosphohydrolase
LQLQSDDLIIGKDVVRKVLEDVGKTIQEQIRNGMNEYKQDTEKRKLELIDIISIKVKDIEDKRIVSLAQLNDAINSSIDAFEAKVKQSIQEIDNLARKGKETLESVAKDGVQNVNKEKENAIQEIQQAAEICKAILQLSKPTYVLTKHKLIKITKYTFYNLHFPYSNNIYFYIFMALMIIIIFLFYSSSFFYSHALCLSEYVFSQR